MKNYYKNKGYAILYTLVIVSIISAISIGVAHSVQKQLVLSSLARDSQMAFYAADTAAECALYANENPNNNPNLGLPGLGSTWNCGKDDKGNDFVIDYSITPLGLFALDAIPLSGGSCFLTTIDKTVPSVITIIVKGYNTCDNSSARQVERGIRVDYQ